MNALLTVPSALRPALGHPAPTALTWRPQFPGFTSGVWLTGNENDQGLSLMLFDSEEKARAAAGRFAVGTNPETGVTITRCEVREVAVSV